MLIGLFIVCVLLATLACVLVGLLLYFVTFQIYYYVFSEKYKTIRKCFNMMEVEQIITSLLSRDNMKMYADEDAMLTVELSTISVMVQYTLKKWGYKFSFDDIDYVVTRELYKKKNRFMIEKLCKFYNDSTKDSRVN